MMGSFLISDVSFGSKMGSGMNFGQNISGEGILHITIERTVPPTHRIKVKLITKNCYLDAELLNC